MPEPALSNYKSESKCIKDLVERSNSKVGGKKRMNVEERIHLALIFIHSFCMQSVSAGGIIAGGAAVLLMQCPLQVRAGICNLFKMPVITRLFFANDTVRSLTPIGHWRQMGRQV